MPDETPVSPLEKLAQEHESQGKETFKQEHADLFPEQPPPPTELPTPDNAPAAPEHSASAPTPGEKTESTTETPPAETPPETKPDQTPPPPQETKQPPPAEEDKAKPGFPWSEFHALKAEQRRARQQQEQPPAVPAEAPPPAAPPAATPPVDETDPFGVRALVQEELGPARAELQQRAAEMERQRIAGEEAAFTQNGHPDYLQAVNYLINTERRDLRNSGGVDWYADQALRNPDPRVQTEIDNRMRFMLARPTAELEQELASGGDPRQIAAREIIMDLHLATRRNMIINGARRQGRNVAEVVWQLAGDRGYKTAETAPGTAAPSVTPVTPAKPQPPSVRANILREKAKSDAARTTSATASATPSPTGAPTEITSLQQWAEFQRRDPEGARSYLLQKIRQDPGWHRKLLS